MLTRREAKNLAGLRRKKNRVAAGLFLVEGVRTSEELFGSRLEYEVGIVYYADELTRSERGERLVNTAQDGGLVLRKVRTHHLDSFTHTVHHQGVAVTVRLPAPSDSMPDMAAMSLILGLDRIADPGNLGTLLRTAAWFGADGVFLSPGSVDLYSPKVVRASAGALFNLQVVPNTDIRLIAAEARRAGITCVAAVAEGGIDPLAEEFPGRSLLLIGSEAEGLSEDLLAAVELKVTVPRLGKGESLNVGVAAGIILARMRAL